MVSAPQRLVQESASGGAGDTPAAEPSPSSADRLLPSLRVLVALGVVAALWLGSEVFIPLVASVLISYALEPIVAAMAARRVPRAWGVPVLMVVLLAIVGGGGYVLSGEARELVDRLPVAAHTVAQAIQRVTRGAPGAVSRVRDAARELESAAAGATKKSDRDGVTAVRIEEPTFRWSDWLWQGSHGAVAFAGQLFAVVFLVYYLLAAGDLYKRKLVRMVPTLSRKKATIELLAEIDRQIERFLLARLGISAIVGVAIWAGFRLFGLEQAGVWGVLAAFLFAIPIVGPIVMVAAATVAAFVQFGSPSMAAAVAAFSTVVGAVEGNVLTPWLMSRAGNMNAVAVFVSLLFWGSLWGPWGLLLAVPITAAIKAVCERVPDYAPVAELLKE